MAAIDGAWASAPTVCRKAVRMAVGATGLLHLVRASGSLVLTTKLTLWLPSAAPAGRARAWAGARCCSSGFFWELCSRA